MEKEHSKINKYQGEIVHLPKCPNCGKFSINEHLSELPEFDGYEYCLSCNYKETWYNVERPPDFNGRVEVRYLEKGKIKAGKAWYETGDRRFPKGFSLLPKHIEVLAWKKI